jgi:uncharacterized damage-inducible protein DinB
MRTTAELVAALRENFDGRPWHGSALRTLVAAVMPERAHLRPSDDVRSAAELLAHAVAWMEIVRERLEGRDEEVRPEVDFPAVDEVSWNDLVGRLDRAFAALLDTVSSKDDAFWQQSVPGHRYTAERMLDGLLHHNSYHGAQIAVISRIVSAR